MDDDVLKSKYHSILLFSLRQKPKKNFIGFERAWSDFRLIRIFCHCNEATFINRMARKLNSFHLCRKKRLKGIQKVESFTFPFILFIYFCFLSFSYWFYSRIYTIFISSNFNFLFNSNVFFSLYFVVFIYLYFFVQFHLFEMHFVNLVGNPLNSFKSIQIQRQLMLESCSFNICFSL